MSSGQSNFRREPCGRCGHDVNSHAHDDDEDIANECEECGCSGFITMTAKTIEKYGDHR